jgi:FKBP-type peptidyl-prolyl cis-trans isomerase
MEQRRVGPTVRSTHLIALVGAAVLFASCSAEEERIEPTEEMRSAALEQAQQGQRPDIDLWEMEVTERGVRFTVLSEGEGDAPFYGDEVRAHYYAWLPDGTLVDSTRPDGVATPYETELGDRRSIVGWDELFIQLQEGSKAIAIIPWELAYGRNGRGAIPGRTDITFYVDLLRVR